MAISGRRQRRSFTRQRRRSRRTAGGVEPGRPEKSGSASMTRASTSATSPPLNARVPVSISKSTQPNAQISARLSTGLPRACSGAMYAAVPRIIPARVIAGVVIVGDIDTLDKDPAAGSVAFARPKSRTFTAPSGRTFTLAGLRSRWTIPCSCAASSASAICVATSSASSMGIGPCTNDPQALAPRRAPSQERSHLPHAPVRRSPRYWDDSARRALRLPVGIWPDAQDRRRQPQAAP